MQISVGHSVRMPKDAEKIAESQWRKDFRARVREAQGDRTDKDMAKLLEISHEQYRKYVSGGEARLTVIPTRHLTKFCLVTNKKIEWLIDGPDEEEAKVPVKSRAKTTRAATNR
jgi:hypothetical protein